MSVLSSLVMNPSNNTNHKGTLSTHAAATSEDKEAYES